MNAAIERLGQKAARGHDALVAGVLVDGASTVYAWRRSGPVPDGDTRFEIGSNTKSFTGVPRADMDLRGEVHLADPVSTYLPERQLPRWNTRPPTLAELATHRAALPNVPRGMNAWELAFALGLRSRDPWAGIDPTAYHNLVRQTRPRKPPGQRFSYSSLGFGLLGDALAARAEMPYEQLLADRVCAPLGMHSTDTSVLGQLPGRSRRGRTRPPLRDLMPAAGAIRSTAGDLLRFLGAALAPADAPLGPAFARATESRERVGRRFPIGIGLGWMVLSRPPKPRMVWHNGGTWGFRSFAAVLPDQRCAVVVLSNTARGVDRLGFALAEIAAAAGGTHEAP
ncbi:MAG: hypothetical protein QOE98_782 [Gaiellaceae bacterium]|nr:hypothetical protein [Gaiellaceae bacterium]